MTTPNEFLCPITMEEMTDPVIGSDGHTYERSAIIRALQSNPKSPITRESMNIISLKPNFALKAALERWKKEQVKTKEKEKEKEKGKGKSKGKKEEPIVVTTSPSYYNALPAENDVALAIAIQTSEIVKGYEEQIKVEQRKVERLAEEQKVRLQRVCIFVGIAIVIFCLVVMFSL